MRRGGNVGRTIVDAMLRCFAAAGWLLACGRSVAQVCAVSLYCPAGGPAPIDIAGDDACTLRLIESGGGSVVASSSASPGRRDLAMLFPELWTLMRRDVMYVQAYHGDDPVGAPLVIEPLGPLPRFTDGWTARALRAVESGDHEAVDRLRRMPPRAASALREEACVIADPEHSVAGLRIYEDRLIVFSTTAGPITVALRPDAAPRTAFHVRSLVEGGWYNAPRPVDVLTADEDARPFVLFLGGSMDSADGGCGWSVDFEASPLPHEPGTVSLARRRDDPNSGSSRLFVCLDSAACRRLDGRYTAFAQVIDGADALRRLVASPAGSHSLLRADLVPAPPAGTSRNAITWAPARDDDPRPVER